MTQDTNGDRELLELAARAASQPGAWIQNEYEGWGFWQHPGGGEWNPITDDGDALRMTVKLRLRINREINCGCDIVEVFGPEADDMSCHCTTEDVVDDPYEATRRAIVRAAAEIGKQMEVGVA